MPDTTYPIESCRNCRVIYWACACGDSPITGISQDPEKIDPKPERCNNVYHQPGRKDLPMDIRLVDYRVCCQSYHHHQGKTCPHCGQKG